jgi:ribosomal protein L37E
MGAVAVHAPASLSGADAELARLRAALDVVALIEVGWDPMWRVFAPSPEHPVFGFRECEVNGCVGVSVTAAGLCNACRLRWRVHQQDLPREEFVEVQRPRIEGCRKREVLCRVCCVPGFERPGYGPTGLCLQCKHCYMRSGVASVDGWIAGGQPRGGAWKTPRPPARPRRSLGWCERCGRRAAHPDPVSCAACRHAWKLAGRPDWDAWAARASAARGQQPARAGAARHARAADA